MNTEQSHLYAILSTRLTRRILGNMGHAWPKEVDRAGQERSRRGLWIEQEFQLSLSGVPSHSLSKAVGFTEVCKRHQTQTRRASVP